MVQVIRIGRLVYTESSKKPVSQTYRRPHAVAVLGLSEALHSLTEAAGSGADDGEREFSLKLYQSEEKDYGLWHEIVARKISSKFSLLSGQSNGTLVVERNRQTISINNMN